jgi:hypothetical protein
VRWIADTLARVERNYDREGSGPGSRFEGMLREDAEAQCVLRLLAAKLLTLPQPEMLRRLRELAEPHR